MKETPQHILPQSDSRYIKPVRSPLSMAAQAPYCNRQQLRLSNLDDAQTVNFLILLRVIIFPVIETFFSFISDTRQGKPCRFLIVHKTPKDAL